MTDQYGDIPESLRPVTPPPPPPPWIAEDRREKKKKRLIIGGCVAGLVVLITAVIIGAAVNAHQKNDSQSGACNRLLAPVNRFLAGQRQAVAGTVTDEDVAATIPAMVKDLKKADYKASTYHAGLADLETQLLQYRVQLLQNKDLSAASANIKEAAAEVTTLANICGFTQSASGV